MKRAHLRDLSPVPWHDRYRPDRYRRLWPLCDGSENRRNQVTARSGLGYEVGSAEAQRAVACGRFGEAGEHHDRRSACGFQQRNERNAVFACQVGVEHDDIGLDVVREFECVAPTSRLAHDLHMRRLALDQCRHAGQDGALIVDEQDCDREGKRGAGHGAVHVCGIGREWDQR